MNTRLEPQLKNGKQIKSILKEAPFSFELQKGIYLKTLLVYLPIKHGKSDHAEFFETIRKGLLYNFVFSCSEIEKKLGVKGRHTPEQLFEKAVRKISKHTAKGELGELILFTLMDVYFQAPKLLSKVSLKTNKKMPVFGADAVHGQFQNGEFRLYLGESKLHKNFKGAAIDAITSIKKAKDKYEEEFDLLDSHMDFPNIDEKLEQALLDFLNPFTKIDFSDAINSPCFIGFSSPDIISNSSSENDFLKKYQTLAKDYVSYFFANTSKKKVEIDEVILLMLPFTCVDQLVDEFIAYMGIEE